MERRAEKNNSFIDSDAEQIPDETKNNELRLSRVNIAAAPRKEKSIVINMNDYLDNQT